MTSSSKKKKDKKKDFQVGIFDTSTSKQEADISLETQVEGWKGSAQSCE
jgi:hypothetical protein